MAARNGVVSGLWGGRRSTFTAKASVLYEKNGNFSLEVDSGLSMTLGAFKFAYWNTSGRPASPSLWEGGVNTDTAVLEAWNGSTWVTL